MPNSWFQYPGVRILSIQTFSCANPPISANFPTMKFVSITDIQKLFAKFEKELSAPSKGDWSDIIHPSQAKLQSALESALETSPRNKQLLKIASNFYWLADDHKKGSEMMERWAEVDKTSIKPIVYHAQYYFDDLLNYEDFLADIKEGLRRKPKSLLVLALAYDGALEEGDDARRLHWAVQLAKVSNHPAHFYICGKELGRNMMFEKAMGIFRAGLKKDKKHIGCLNGLGQCYLERLDLDRAEECLEKSMAIRGTAFAKKSLKYIESLQKGKSSKELEKKQKKLWQKWSDEELMRISKEEQKRLVAERFVGRTRK